ncbi:glutathione S-transferase family protein [Shewanella metallivivens]|uniref:Glutathione S-transferase family protein n=1 Tax=Shewanella metallivivens TaxID=2872342 RepID=A0ABT5TLR0_9GAMM|nr:glutathione S-transferase family protein [Shewanella metallivivens]MDD8059546.1 glutathione S-transferase family protein [Shewanella metallivivens]
MKLYGSYTSPFVRHCRIALLESTLDYEFIETDQVASATLSPTKRVPLLQDGEMTLHDSSAILHYIRNKSDKPFIEGAVELDQYCLINTALDSTINLFFLARDGVDIERYEYTLRQTQRIESTLKELEQLKLPLHGPYDDVQLRLACYLSWAVFRQRINIDSYPKMKLFLAAIEREPLFIETAPPA